MIILIIVFFTLPLALYFLPKAPPAEAIYPSSLQETPALLPVFVTTFHIVNLTLVAVACTLAIYAPHLAATFHTLAAAACTLTIYARALPAYFHTISILPCTKGKVLPAIAIYLTTVQTAAHTLMAVTCTPAV